MIVRLKSFRKNNNNPIQSQERILMFRILGAVYMRSGTG